MLKRNLRRVNLTVVRKMMKRRKKGMKRRMVRVQYAIYVIKDDGLLFVCFFFLLDYHILCPTGVSVRFTYL